MKLRGGLKREEAIYRKKRTKQKRKYILEKLDNTLGQEGRNLNEFENGME